MKIEVFPDAGAAARAAADRLCGWLVTGGRTFLAAAGNSPLELYRQVAWRSIPLDLHVFALDEYLGVPEFDPRTCGNVLRRAVAEAWRLPRGRFHDVRPIPGLALVGIREHEALIDRLGGLDAAVLGLGRNGHLGFNEPGSAPDSVARVVPLEPPSVEANRRWFGGEYAPDHGATLGLRTILAARRILLLAFGPSKSDAVRAMVRGSRSVDCPASWLQDHAEAHVFIDRDAAVGL